MKIASGCKPWSDFRFPSTLPDNSNSLSLN